MHATLRWSVPQDLTPSLGRNLRRPPINVLRREDHRAGGHGVNRAGVSGPAVIS
jgi:hypothetical protein